MTVTGIIAIFRKWRECVCESSPKQYAFGQCGQREAERTERGDRNHLWMTL